MKHQSRMSKAGIYIETPLLYAVNAPKAPLLLF